MRVAGGGGGARLLPELAVAPDLLAPGGQPLRSMGRPSPGSAGGAAPGRRPPGCRLRGAALALPGLVTTLWQYYLAFGVLAGAGIACIQVPAAAIVGRWFVRSRGAAMGIISAGASASAIIFYPVNTYLVVVFGWRTALVIFGLLVAIVTIPLAACLYREPATN